MKRYVYIRVALIILSSLVLFPGPSSAETGKLNLHLELGPSFAVANWQLKELGPGASGNLAVELALKPWLGVQAGAGYFQFFGVSTPQAGFARVDKPYLFLTGLGARFRPLNDENGYLRPWKRHADHTGNLWGNLFMDVSVGYALTGGLNRLGASVGMGYEFSLFNALQIGPFVRGIFVYQPRGASDRASEDAWLLNAGLSFSLAMPPTGMRMRDTDGDGLFDQLEKCPKIAEDKDGFEDDDGCPDPDNDGDGIRDEDDECPLEAEDFDGFEDENGCPEVDNDLDGIRDAADKCPDEREDFDKFEDADGCPDLDNDADGVADDLDRCPDEKESINQIEDEDGCPEVDTDKDGVLDAQDLCPDEAETINGIDDDDGCPDKGLVEVKADRILLGERIFFDLNQLRIRAHGREVLLHLSNLLKVHPEYELVYIEGHADRSGTEPINERISKRRAEQVKAYLVKLGVDESRLTVEGLGAGKPWVPYGPESNAGKNRRVEVVIKKIASGAHTAEAVQHAVDAQGAQDRATDEDRDE